MAGGSGAVVAVSSTIDVVATQNPRLPSDENIGKVEVPPDREEIRPLD